MSPPWTLWSTSSDTRQVVETKKEPPYKMYTPFWFIRTICAVCVLNPHQWSLTIYFQKLKPDAPKVSKHAEAKKEKGQRHKITISTNFIKKTMVLWKRYESTLWSTRSETHKVIEIQWGLGCIPHFDSDLIYNMDHMRISGTKPSSVIRSQTMYVVSKVENCPKNAEKSWS